MMTLRYQAPLHRQKRAAIAESLASLAVMSLIEEAALTPKPALVDQRGSGAHTDLTFDLMCRSAVALHGTFAEMAYLAWEQVPGQQLREQLATIGRTGEEIMLATTRGVNTHRGAIWALGLLVAGAAIEGTGEPVQTIADLAGEIASYPDRYRSTSTSHGVQVMERYGVEGARGEAKQHFPHIMSRGLPRLQTARAQGASETCARLDALLAIMAHLNDTCLLYRGGKEALTKAQSGAQTILHVGGTMTTAGRKLLSQLEHGLLARNVSPGGSADLLAATLFLDALTSVRERKGDYSWKH
jgi:triphosphoribosyl-dephospho-CoA synthase